MTAPSETHSNIDTDTFAAYSEALQTAALTTTRLAATSLPADLSFHRSIDPALARDADILSDRILALANKLVYVASGKTNKILEQEDILDEFVRNVVDPMEGVLEGTDGALDVFLGKRKDPAIHVATVPAHPSRPKKQPFRGRLDPALTHAAHIPKPQFLFKHKLSTTDESPYIPAMLIPHKWCAKVPLGYVYYDEGSNQDIGDVGEDEDEDEEGRRKRSLHPYYYELTHPSYPDHVFNLPVKTSLPSSLGIPSAGASTASHPITFVSTPEAFLSMAKNISLAIELAVDLEHHSYRSYRGFLALMQISTRQEDFVVDLLVPDIREGLRQAKNKTVEASEEACTASEAGRIIARIFADPSVIKVFHGAESDILWLQQDFNIFVVGLFDTFHASKLLEFPKHSLAHLLETYCDFTPDKRYQLADWRIRPLPAEMSTYARSDTHFLLYIYDVLRLSFIERPSVDSVVMDDITPMNTKPTHRAHGLIRSVLSRSARTALRLYETETYDAESGTGPSGWDTLARKWNKVWLVGSATRVRGATIQESQAKVYRAVHRWREDVAREEDESTRYVLPTHYLFLLAERIPTTVSDLVSLFGGPGGVNGGVPPALKRRTGELVVVIKEAVEAASPQGTTKDKHEDGQMVVSTAVEELEAMTYTTASTPSMAPTYESRLWTIVPSSTSVRTILISPSSLFGSEEKRTRRTATPPFLDDAKKTYFTSRSMLFGSAFAETMATSSHTASSTVPHAQASDDSAERFQNLMEKIHKTLFIAPLVSVPPFVASIKASDALSGNVGPDEDDAAAAQLPDTLTGPVGQVEIPFVPVHKRQTISSPQNDGLKGDTIVVVGTVGARQRKRKRDKARGVESKSGNGAETTPLTVDHDQEMKEFDYSSVPNLLDESKHEDARHTYREDEKRKKKQRHGKGLGPSEYGECRAPPRDQREVRSGNKTRTFG